MLLGLACGNVFLDSAEESSSATISVLSPDLATVAKQAFYDFGDRPTWTERAVYAKRKFIVYHRALKAEIKVTSGCARNRDL